MSDLVRASVSLLERTRSLATLNDEELRRFAMEAARDRDAEALWSLTEAHLILHGSSGSKVSPNTLESYKRYVKLFVDDWAGENLLRPSRNAGVLWVRGLEARHKPATVRVKLAAAKALYAALRWSGATEAAPFADVKPARDKTPAWEKQEAYTRVEVDWLMRCAEGANLLIVLLGAHAGLRVSEMTALEWEDLDLGSALLKVRKGKGDKAGTIYLSPSLVEALEAVLLEERHGFVLPCRSRQTVSQRLEGLCRRARVKFKGVHALRHAAGTRLRAEQQDLALVADHLRQSTLETARGYAKRENKRLREAVGEW